MNILHLEASSGWGGQEIRILREAEGMRQRGHRVILGVMRKGRLVQKAKEAGFPVYEINFKKPFWIFSLFQILYLLVRHRIDLVNTHSSLDGWIGGIAARLGGRKIVRTRHLSTPIKKGLNSRLLYGKLSDFVVTTCESIVSMIALQSGKEAAKVRSIATGVDPEKIRYSQEEALQFRKSIGVKADDFLVGTACVMRSWKGIADLLKAADLLRHIPHLHWVVIGGGHFEIHHAKAKELKLEGIVHFTGHLENPFPAIGALDVFSLLSTANEGVSQAILQAAFLKKPLIATKTGGLCEVCIEGKTGFSVPVFDPESVAQSVLKLMSNPSLQREFGENGRHLVLESFTMQKTLDRMEDAYRKTEAF